MCHACSSPLERDPHESYLSSGSTLCVTPERVIHSTRMDSRDQGFSLTVFGLGSTFRGLALLFGFLMSDLSTLSSGTSVLMTDV